MGNSNLMPSYDEVRRHERIPINVLVRFFLGEGKVTSGRAYDIAEGGMYIYVPLDLTVGTLVNISFQLPYSRIMFGVQAIVRNSAGFHYGVEFANLTSSESAEIERIISILKPNAPSMVRTEPSISAQKIVS
jgi:hypothetical protein